MPGSSLIVILQLAVVAPDPGCAAREGAPKLDHVILAFRDLETAATRFRGLGYRLKPGRPHPNGLLNHHVKFRDGTEIELMTVAGPPTDRMAREYQALIASGDGGVYAALRIASLDSVEAVASRLGLGPRRSTAGAWQFLSFAPESPISAVFFVAGGYPAEDSDSILTHADSARSLVGASLEAGPELARLLEPLGAAVCSGRFEIAGRAARRIALAGSTLTVTPPRGPGPPRVLEATLATGRAPSRRPGTREAGAGFRIGYR